MIQVQIASQVSTTGVDGIRWVLMEASAAAIEPALTPAAMLAAAQPAGRDQGRDPAARPAVPLAVVKLAVLAFAAGLALWLAQAAFGPALRGQAPAGTPAAPAAPAALPQPAGALPHPLAPARPASAIPLITADSR